MATLGASSSSNTSPRWGGTGDPGSAFSGLSSRGRGRGAVGGGGGGGRGGRGRARGGLSEVDIPKTKPDNSQSSTSPSTKSSSPSTPTPGKPNVPPTSSLKLKTISRRGSRALSVAAVPQIHESVLTPSGSPHTPAKVTHKRRRSQAGKPALVLPKANPPKLTDGPHRSNKLHINSHTETLKDIPPHLINKFDVRNDIDALVERVRAVAMDNRPSTPKNHIDWAVDDDDTLPDLDDWGVTTSTLTTQLERISPIIVDGLRPLPEFAVNSTAPSSLKQVEAVMILPIIDAQSSSVNDMTSDTIPPPNLLNTKEKDIKSQESNPDPWTATSLNSTKSPQLNSNISLHSSLPAKPLSVVQHTSKSRPRASPMRIVPHLKSPTIPMVDISGIPERLPAANSEQADAREPVEIAFEMTDYKPITRTPEPRLKGSEQLIAVEPLIMETVILNVSPGRGTDYPQTAQEPSPSGLSGLSASIHAPNGIADSVSAPVNLSTYADSRTHNSIHTHARAHTVGRSPLPDSIYGQGDGMPRVTRSGHTTPRGGFQVTTSHARTHSTPPPGGANHRRSPHTSRPVITGDAISRLARTIGKTHNNLSPSLSQSSVTHDMHDS